MGLVEKGGIRQTCRRIIMNYSEVFWLNIYDLGLFENEVHPTGHTAIFRHPPLQPRGDNVFVKLPSPDWISLKSFEVYALGFLCFSQRKFFIQIYPDTVR
jgi:hypothetical protein